MKSVLDSMESEIILSLKDDLADLKSTFSDLESTLSLMDGAFDRMDSAFDRMDSAFKRYAAFRRYPGCSVETAERMRSHLRGARLSRRLGRSPK